MHIDWWTLALQTINLLVLVWILSRFLFRPVAGIIRERQAAAEELLARAAEERRKAEEEEQQAGREKEEAEKARSKVLQSAGKEAEAEKAQILADARKEAEALRAAAKAEVEKLRMAAEAQADARASALALDIAAKLFARLPDGAKVEGFIEGLADAVGELPDTARNEIGADGKAVTLTAAREITAGERTACETALAKALGRKVSVTVQADPALIAGLELETPHAAVRNSFRADLDRISAELADHAEA